MHLYWVIPNTGSEWGVFVVHCTSRKARLLGYRAMVGLTCADDYWFTDCRSRRVREATVPADIAEPRVYEEWDDVEWIASVCGTGEEIY